MNKNILENYITCPNCKNIYLKTHIKYHYENCRKYDKNQSKNTEIKKNEFKKNIKENASFFQNMNDNNFCSKTVSEQNLQLDNYISPELISYNDTMLNQFFKKYEQLFVDFIKDKCIALVGPAQSIIGTNKGDIIDKFDLVVRLNKSIPLPQSLKDDIGMRTDIIYNSLNTSDFPGENKLSPKLHKKYGVKFVCSSYPFNHNIFHDDITNYVYKYKFELPLKVMNDFKFRNFEKVLGTRPYTGTCAIMDLLSYPIKYLYITGLDFYQTKYYSEYRRVSKDVIKYNKNNIIHQCKPQLDYLKNISFFDNRIILDSFLDKLLYHDYYKVFKNLMSYEKNNIFKFGDPFFQKYFEMKISSCTFTKSYSNNNKNIDSNQNQNPFLILTDNKYFKKEFNEYCIFITNEKNMLNMLNNNLESKKFIGNFFYTENKNNPATIYLSERFLNHLKSTLTRIGINNCNLNLVILLSIILYLPDQHFFSYNEIFNYWKLTIEEKKLILFLSKKKMLHLFN